MRKFVVAGAASLGLLGTWAAVANPNDTQPQARAYLSIPFGGAPAKNKDLNSPFHYGLRVDYDSRLRTLEGRELPALMQLDSDALGNRIASVGGVPFAGRIQPPLRQNEGDSAPASSGSGGFTFFDWSLLAVGVGGVGYLIYEVSKSKDSPDVQNGGGSTTGSTTGTTTGVVTGVVNTVTGVVTGVVNAVTGTVTGAVTNPTGVVNTVTGVVTGVVNTVTGVLTGTTGFTGSRSVEGVLPFDPVEYDGQSYQQWLDGGTGHMGDLKPR